MNAKHTRSGKLSGPWWAGKRMPTREDDDEVKQFLRGSKARRGGRKDPKVSLPKFKCLEDEQQQ